VRAATGSAAGKAVLRRHVRTARGLRPPAAREAAGRAFTDFLVADPTYASARVVAAYVGVADEPPTDGVLDDLRGRGVRVLLPILRGDGELDWAEDNGIYVDGPHGLREPAGDRLGVDAITSADAVVVPALAVDVAGNRLGQGGGAYDRALARTRVLSVALVFDDEVLEAVPTEPHDVGVHMAVTPTQALHFRT
jgi:5-formyltetrahydrofolate cyclo-ligase